MKGLLVKAEMYRFDSKGNRKTTQFEHRNQMRKAVYSKHIDRQYHPRCLDYEREWEWKQGPQVENWFEKAR